MSHGAASHHNDLTKSIKSHRGEVNYLTSTMTWVNPPPRNSQHQEYIYIYITFLVGDPCKSLFATGILGWGVDPNHEPLEGIKKKKKTPCSRVMTFINALSPPFESNSSSVDLREWQNRTPVNSNNSEWSEKQAVN